MLTLLFLDKNPLETEKENLADIKVLMTIKENKVIYKNGEDTNESAE